MRWLLICLFVLSGSAVAGNRDYTYLYFENGYPTRLKSRRSQKQANLVARANPDLVIQTGYYSLRFDCDDVQLTGYDVLEGSDYLSALNEDVNQFTPAELTLKIFKDGVEYACTSGLIQDKHNDHIRLIESGQFVQRFDHTGLIFTSESGDTLEGVRLEITAWPDQVVFLLDSNPWRNNGVQAQPASKDWKVGILLTTPSGNVFQTLEKGRTARLVLRPHLDQQAEPLNADCLSGGQFNANEHGLQLDLSLDRLKFPRDKDRLDEFVFTLRNPSDAPQKFPLIFNETEPRGITGTSMMLCDEQGHPTGIPVQVSKNWHNDPESRVTHDGSWLRGYSVVELAAGETRTFRLKVIKGYWGGVPAVSFSQLSVIGYGGNWKWDESALGCWGESMCYDPSQHLGSSFITDVRPSFTTGMNGRPYSWTENTGGGDFLIYVDSGGMFRHAKKLKTAYHWTGPNMTDIHYSGVTDDDAIRFHYRIRLVRTGDYHRRFHAYRVEFLKDVDSPQRLVFHQMAADYYASSKFDRFYVGDGAGLRKTIAEPIPFEKSWLAIEDEKTVKGEPVMAVRGLLSLSSELNGKPMAPFLHRTATRRRQVLFGLGFEEAGHSYAAGDVVSGELEFIMPPKRAGDYWGQDREFAARLAVGSNVWQMVADEYRHNVQLTPVVEIGELIVSYPLEIKVTPGDVVADVTIPGGGIGHVPVILRGVSKDCALQAEYYLSGGWVAVGPEGAYQAVRNRDGTLDCSFNICRPGKNLTESWRVRFRIR